MARATWYSRNSIYTVSQNISGLEIEVGKGSLTSAQALEKANAFAVQVQPRQTLLLRIGMVAIPLLTLTGAYLPIRKNTVSLRRRTRKSSQKSWRNSNRGGYQPLAGYWD